MYGLNVSGNEFSKDTFEYNLYENLTEDMGFNHTWLTNKMKSFKMSAFTDLEMDLEFKSSYLRDAVQLQLNRMTPYGAVRWYAMYNVLYNTLCKLYDVEIPWLDVNYNTLEEAFSGKIATCTLTVINPLNVPLCATYGKLLYLNELFYKEARGYITMLMNDSINAKSVEDAIIDMAHRIIPSESLDIFKDFSVEVTPVGDITHKIVDRYQLIHAFPMDYHVVVTYDNGCKEEFNTKALLITVDVANKYYNASILKCDVIPAKDDEFLNNEIDDIYQYVSSLITDPEYTIDPEIARTGIITDLTAIGEYINAATEDCQIGDIEIEEGYQFYFAGALNTIFSINTIGIPDVTPGYMDWDDYYDDDDDEDDLDDDEEEDDNYDEDNDE